MSDYTGRNEAARELVVAAKAMTQQAYDLLHDAQTALSSSAHRRTKLEGQLKALGHLEGTAAWVLKVFDGEAEDVTMPTVGSPENQELAALLNQAFKDPPQVAFLARALGCSVTFTYSDDHVSGGPSARKIAVMNVTSTVFGGHDVDRDGYRSFRFDRLTSDLALCATPEGS